MFNAAPPIYVPFIVSILVFVELALDDYQYGHRRSPAQVSILVFVELALDAGADQLKQIVGRMFQSLFSWNLLLMTGQVMVRVPRYYMFQSLFSWNLLLMPVAESMYRVPAACFNPCFRGTCS